MKQNTVTLSVSNWSQFNPRSDSKKHYWFRFDNEFFIKTSSWTPTERNVFLYACCQISQAKADEATIDLNLASFLLKQTCQEIVNDLTTLNERGLITLKSNLELLKVTSSNFKLLPFVRENPGPTQHNSTQHNTTEQKSASTCEKTHKSRRLRGPIFEFQEHVTIEDMLSSVTHNLQKTWISVYVDVPWLRQEVLKAVAWEAANPRKVSKDKGRFLTNWFSRGWESHRKSQPSGGKSGVEIWAEEQARKEEEGKK